MLTCMDVLTNNSILYLEAGVKQAYRMQSFAEYMSAARAFAGLQCQTICSGCWLIAGSGKPVTTQNCRT